MIDSPSRFSTEVQSALEREMPGLRPATLRARFHFRDSAPIAEQVQILDGIAKRGSHGVILKAPDVPEINAAVLRLDQAKIPVVTVVTDLPASVRRAYVGLDNRAAGSTAAFLVHQWMHDQLGSVLVTRGDGLFRGEVFIAHDLDEDHRTLLLDGDVSALLHHDLREDMRHACRIIMQEHGALPGRPMSAFSAVQVVTPYNLPPRTIA